MIFKCLKDVRLCVGLIQEKLGVMVGIEEVMVYLCLFYYESGMYKFLFELVCSFVKVLDVLECYFYIVDDEFVEVVLVFYQGFKIELQLKKVKLE